MNKQTKNLLIFFAATFVWTWGLYAPIAAGGHNPYQMPGMILLICGGMGPSVVGVGMTLLTLDKGARRDYWRRCFSFKRISGLWWAILFLLFPILHGLSILIDMAMGGSLPEMAQLGSLIANPLMIPLAALISFMSGPWSEEFGWRGYAWGAWAPAPVLHARYLAWTDRLWPDRLLDVHAPQRRTVAGDDVGLPENI